MTINQKRTTAFATIALLILLGGLAICPWLQRTTGVNYDGAASGPGYTAPADPPVIATEPDGTAKFGYEPDRKKSDEFIRSLGPRPDLKDRAPQLFQVADPQPVFLYRALYDAYREHSGGGDWRVGRQGIGDCVSWGWAHGHDIALAVQWKIGESSEWRPAATEAIYGGSRVEARGRTTGGWSDGSYGSAAAKWVRDWGIVYRQPYDAVDLTSYSAQRAKQWGNYGCGGQNDNGRLDGTAKDHPIKDVALVTTFEEAAAAIASGYPVPVCSMRGFASTRDNQGFCRPSGSWAHCMCFIAVRYDRPGLLCLNSWGTSWVSGPKFPDDMPDGSFWVDAATATSMLSGRDSFAVAGTKGFPYRKLDHGDWVQVTPRRTPEAETHFALAP